MTSTLQIEKIVCPGCYSVLDVEDRFCRHCGIPTREPAGSAVGRPQAVTDRSPAAAPWSENRWAVLAMLLLVLGPLGLPMLWRSRQFTPAGKAVLTALVLGVTVVIFMRIWYTVQKTLEPLMQLRNMHAS